MQYIFYTPPKNNFSVIPNKILHSDNLSNNAKLTALMLISLPKDFKLNGAYLAKRLNMSLRTLQRALKELIESGMLIKTQAKNEDGSFNKFSVFVFIDENTEDFCGKLSEDLKVEAKENLEQIEEEEIENFNETLSENEALEKEPLEVHFNETLQDKNKETSRIESNLNAKEKQEKDFKRGVKKPQADFCRTYKEINLYTKKENFYTLAFLKNEILIHFAKQREAKRISLNYEGLNQSELSAIEEFFSYRKEKSKGKSLTLSTKKAILQKCKDFKNKGLEIESIINKSIENGWSGLFEPKIRQGNFIPKGKDNFSISREIINEILKIKPNFELYDAKAAQNLKIGGKKVIYDEKTCMYSLV